MTSESTAGARSAAFVGGPIYRLYLQLDPDRTVVRDVAGRIAAVAALAWLPLALLALVAPSGSGVPFFRDLEVHLKFLVALPILVASDLIIQPRVLGAVRQFGERDLVAPADRPRFEAAFASALRWRDSRALELVVVALVFSLGHWIWRQEIALGTATWFATVDAAGPHLTREGLWYLFVSAPIFRFFLFLGYARLVLWLRFLWQVSRLDLRIVVTHPDRAGGLGFVGSSLLAFSPFLFAQGTLLAGMLGNRIFHEGRTLASFRLDIAALAVLVLALVLAPLLVFAPRLARERRRGLRAYGRLASRYVREFDDKWIRSAPPTGEALVGTADLQSLADLGNSYAVAQEMGVLPFTWPTVVRLAAALLAPLAPLLLTALPIEEIFDRLVQLVL